jgi:hypothetical protein
MQASLKRSSTASACAWRQGPARKISVTVRAAEGTINPSIKKDVEKASNGRSSEVTGDAH